MTRRSRKNRQRSKPAKKGGSRKKTPTTPAKASAEKQVPFQQQTLPSPKPRPIPRTVLPVSAPIRKPRSRIAAYVSVLSVGTGLGIFYVLCAADVNQLLVPSPDSGRTAAAGFLLSIAVAFGIVRILTKWSRYESGSFDVWDVRSFAGRPLTPFWSRALTVFASMSAAMAVVLWPMLSRQMECWHTAMLADFLWHPATLTAAEIVLVALLCLAISIPAAAALFCLHRESDINNRWSPAATGWALLGLGGGMILARQFAAGTMPAAIAFLVAALIQLMQPERTATAQQARAILHRPRLSIGIFWFAAAIITAIAFSLLDTEHVLLVYWLKVALAIGWLLGVALVNALRGAWPVLAVAGILAPALLAFIHAPDSTIGQWTIAVATAFWGVLLGGLLAQRTDSSDQPARQGLKAAIRWPAVVAAAIAIGGFFIHRVPDLPNHQLIDMADVSWQPTQSDTCLALGLPPDEWLRKISDAGAEITVVPWPTTVSPSPAKIIRAMRSRFTIIIVTDPPEEMTNESAEPRLAGWLADRVAIDGVLLATDRRAESLADYTRRVHAERCY